MPADGMPGSTEAILTTKRQPLGHFRGKVLSEGVEHHSRLSTCCGPDAACHTSRIASETLHSWFTWRWHSPHTHLPAEGLQVWSNVCKVKEMLQEDSGCSVPSAVFLQAGWWAPEHP